MLRVIVTIIFLTIVSLNSSSSPGMKTSSAMLFLSSGAPRYYSFFNVLCDDKIYSLDFFACATRIGESIQGRDINIFEIGSGPVKILFIGGLHTGREDNTRLLAGEILSYFLGKPNEVQSAITLYILPNANPDGAANKTHNNSRGVDLNRNWPTQNWRSDPYHPSYGRVDGAGGASALSEPETKSLYNFILEKRPSIIFSWHSRAGIVEGNDIGFASELAEVYARAAQYTQIYEWPYYEVTGAFGNAMEEAGIPAVDIELSTYKNTEFKKNLKGVNAVLNHISQGSRQ